MRRVLRFLLWRADWWQERAIDWDGVDPDVADGLRAYALRQADTCTSISQHFSRKWAQSDVRAARDAAAATSALLGLEGTIMAQLDV